MEEFWVAVDVCPGYEVSNFGNFRSIDRLVDFPACRRAKGYTRFLKGKAVNPFICKSTGYLQIKVKGKKYNVHRLVAFAHCEGYADGLVVNHKNGIRSDNRAENLEWVTQSENNLHAFRVNGRVPTSLGKFSGEHPTSKAVISTDMKTGEEKFYEAAMDAVREGFDSSSISRCCNGENAYHKGKYWRFAEIRNAA
ncbi:HNH endonuclease [Cronobacter turicensis]